MTIRKLQDTFFVHFVYFVVSSEVIPLLVHHFGCGSAALGRKYLPVRLHPTLHPIALVIAIVVVVVIAPAPAPAHAPFTFGFGPRAIAMGGAFAGLADDISGPYYNPAGMTQRKVVQIGGGYQYIKPWMTVKGDSFRVRDNHSNSLGATLPLPFGGWLENRLFLGLAFFMPWDLVLGLEVPFPGDPQFLLFENEPRVTTIMPAFAVELHPALSIGAAVNLYDDTFGSFNATLTSENVPVLEVNQELIATFNPTVAVHLRPGAIWPGTTLT